MLGLAFQQAYNPIYFSIRKEETAAGMRRLAETARNVWAASVGCAVGAALLGPPLIVLVTPADYHGAAPLVPIFALGFLGMTAYNLLGPEVFYSKRTWLVPVIVYGAAGMEIAIAVLTVKTYGAAGVASGAAARMIVAAVIAGIISCRLVTIPYAWFSMIRIATCGAMAFVPIYLFASDRVLWQLLAGVGGVLAYAGLLWLSGDPSIRDISSFLKRRFFSGKQ
jgi:O-antigen/teichoic acid export membrane protein